MLSAFLVNKDVSLYILYVDSPNIW